MSLVFAYLILGVLVALFLEYSMRSKNGFKVNQSTSDYVIWYCVCIPIFIFTWPWVLYKTMQSDDRADKE